MYLRPFLSHRTVPFRSTRSSRSAFHSVVADLGGKAENLLTDEAFRSCDCPQVLLSRDQHILLFVTFSKF